MSGQRIAIVIGLFFGFVVTRMLEDGNLLVSSVVKFLSVGDSVAFFGLFALVKNRSPERINR